MGPPACSQRARGGSVEGTMLEQYRRVVPFILAGLLLVNLVQGIANGGPDNWIMVAVLALVLALTLWWRRRAERGPKDPPQR